MHLILIALIFCCPLWAHQSSLTGSGAELYWASKSIPLVIRTNTTDMSAVTVDTIIRDSINQWNSVSSSKFVPSSSAKNEITFLRNFPYGSAVIGLTEMNYNSAGAIQKAVIYLNDDFQFRSAPGVYSSNQVFLGDVVTHEIGHAYGLSHSEILNSSMFYSSFSGQSTLSSDDKAGVRNKYDSGFGTITGYVKGGNQIGVLGVHVQAISRRTGETVGGITNDQGYFRLGGLNLNDTYYLYTSPVKNPNSLPSYYSNVQNKFCPASYVGSFFQGCDPQEDGKPQGISLTQTTPAVNVGTVTINCSLKTDSNYNYQKLQTSFSPVTIYDFARDQRYQKAFTGWFRKPTNSDWSIYDELNIDLTNLNTSGTQKYLKVSLVSFPFGNLLEYNMIASQNGVLLPDVNLGINYSVLNGTYNTDFESLVPLSLSASENFFSYKIRSRKLQTAFAALTFPSFDKFANDSYLPYLVIASVWEMRSGVLSPVIDSEVELSDNTSCLDAPFTYEVAKAKSIKEFTSTGGDQLAPASCATISSPGDGPGPGSSLPLLTLGFALVLMANSLGKRCKKFLS